MDIASKSLQLGRRIRHLGRLAQIANTFARHGLWTLAERIGLANALTPAQVREAQEISDSSDQASAVDVEEVKGLPARLRRAFEELGPAFVKLGQVLAVREDLLPKEYIEELGKLHFNVSPLPFATIQQVLLAELGEQKLKQFASINEKPLAAGSIAQVHEAVLASGEKVILKVQRPGIDAQIRIDLSLMGELASLLERYVPESRITRPSAMVTEFSRALLGELDFIREGGNITKISRNFKDVDHVVVPEVKWSLTTTRVMTQTLIEGLPAWDRERMVATGLDPTLLVERGLGMFLKMVFVDGLYHGDLHPGNILALAESRVGVIDFGLCVHLGRSTRDHLAGLLIGLIEEDFNRVVMHYVELADPSLDFDAEAFEHEVGNAVAPFIGLSLADLRSGRLFWDLARVAARNGAPMPQELVIFIKTLVSFEGIGTHLDPSFDIMATAKDFTAEIVREIYSPDNLRQQALLLARDTAALAKHAPLQLRRLLKASLEGSLSVGVKSEELGRLAVAVDRSSSRLAISLIIASLIVGSSILTFSRVSTELTSVPLIGLIGFALAGILGVYVVVSVLRGRRM